MIIKPKWLMIVLLLTAVSFLTAVNNLIVEIEVEGNQNVQDEFIISALSFEVGDVYNESDISNSIKTLYNLKIFEDIYAEKSFVTHGVQIKIIVNEFPVVSEIAIQNNRKLSDDKVLEITGIKEGLYWADYMEKEYTRLLQEEYTKKRYNFIQIDYQKKDLTNNQIELTINIDEGEKTRVKNISFHGNKTITSKELKKEMDTKEAGIFRSGKFEEEAFQEDLQNILSYYHEEGYIDASIISHEEKMVDEKNMHIDIYVFEGEKFQIGDIYIDGNSRFNDEVLLDNFRYKEDQTFDMKQFDEDLNIVRSLYFEEGFIYAQITDDIVKNSGTVDIYINVQENTRAKVRKINIAGNRRTKEKIIRRMLQIRPGDYFQRSKVMQSQQNIYNMGIFEPDIGIDYNPINNNGDIDLNIDVADKSSGSANGGIGYNTQNSLVGQFSISHNNLFGNGWQIAFKTEFGGEYQSFDLDFTNPYFYDTSTLVGAQIYHTLKDWSSFDYKVYTSGGSARIGLPMSFLNRSKIIFGYSLYSKRYEVYDNSEVSDYLQDLDAAGTQNTSSVFTTISRDTRDNIYFPTTGTKFSLYSEVAGGPMQGDFDYYKQIAEVSWYTKTFWKLALRTKWRFGYVKEFGQSEEVPPDERFYLGGTGANGLRGYPDQSVGPVNGGHRMVLFSTEYTIPIAQDTFSGLLFFDAGDANNHLEEFNFSDLKKGGGAGLRVMTPLGLLGFDMAWNFDEGKWEPHFQFGTIF